MSTPTTDVPRRTRSRTSMLTYEEELELSDRLVARRALRQALQEAGEQEPRSERERRVLREGDEAATQLVEAYLPFLRAAASRVQRHTDRRGTSVELEDLVNAGALAMLGTADAFNARGTDGHRGRRFATYSRPQVVREMQRLVTRMSTPLYLNVDVISATWVWVAASAELEARLGRRPTDAEVEEETSISADFVVRDLPSRVGMVDVADEALLDGTFDAPAVDSDPSVYDRVLEDTLRAVLDDTVVDVLLSQLGVGADGPRTVAEVARHLGMRRKDVEEYEQFAHDALLHPQNRGKIVRLLREAEARGLVI